MKFRNILILTAICCMGTTAMAEKHPLPSDKELKQINDSICHEALLLYNAEKCAWNATDIASSHQDIKEKVNCCLTYQVNEETFSTICINTEEWICYFRYNWTQGEGTSVFDTCQVSPEEKEEYLKSIKLTNQIMQMKVVPENSSYGGMNKQILHLNENLTRVYFLQGTYKNYSIPFGNDFCFDFDSTEIMTTWRKFHSGLIDYSWEKGNEPVSLIHSHQETTPYISTTEICTFLLYGVDQFGMKRFCVYSKYFEKVFEFDAEKKHISCFSMKHFMKNLGKKR